VPRLVKLQENEKTRTLAATAKAGDQLFERSASVLYGKFPPLIVRAVRYH